MTTKLSLDPSGNYLALYTNRVDKEKAKFIGDYLWNWIGSYWSYALCVDKYNKIISAFGNDLVIDNSVRDWLKQEEEHRKTIVVYRAARKMHLPDGFVPKLKLFDHQTVGVQAILEFKKFILSDELGLGKSAQAINAFLIARNKGEVNRLLVIAPKSLLYNWQQEILKHSDIDSQIISGSKQKRISLLKNIQSPVVIVSYDTIRVHSEDDYFSDFAKSQFSIYDEATYLKNPRAKRSRAILDIESKYKVLLTGTPVGSRPEDCYNLIKTVRPGMWRHWWDFQDKYLVKNIFGGIYQYKNLDDLREKLESVSLRRLKSEVLDLPPKVYENRVVDMPKKQSEKYNICLSELRLAFEQCGEKSFSQKYINFLVMFTRLKQISDGFLSDGKHIEFLPDAGKFKELDDIINNYDGKIVVWCSFVPLVKYLVSKYSDKAVPFYGDMNEEERNEALTKFKNDKDCKLFISQVNTGGYGINLYESQLEIFFDIPNSPIMLLQAQDRCHRIGQTGTVVIIYLLSDGSIDLKLLKSMQKKFNMINQITGDSEKIGYHEMKDLLKKT